ncbi:MAG TPA: CBS domain-containing protein [Sandaracinaceae bacterium LLY-WYZ-13_1]|nr:CBS domain-containing protein [Sandaracinaceae bacterium LLY-WYZ-13_1]
MLARDLMTPDVVTLDTGATIADAVALVTEHEIRHVPILDDDRLVGIISDRDLRRIEGLLAQDIANPERSENVLGSPVTALISRHPVTCAVETHVDEVIDLLVMEGVGAVVVCDGGAIAGIISVLDVLEAARGRLG